MGESTIFFQNDLLKGGTSCFQAELNIYMFMQVIHKAIVGIGFSWCHVARICCAAVHRSSFWTSPPLPLVPREHRGPKISRHTRIAMDSLVAMSMNIDHYIDLPWDSEWCPIFWTNPHHFNMVSSLETPPVEIPRLGPGDVFFVQSAIPLNHASGMIF